MGRLSSFAHRAVVFCTTVTGLAIGTIAPLRSAALSQITHTLHKTSLPNMHVLHRVSAHASHRVAHTGYWHTDGSRIVSDRHTTVRISGVNWSGLETTAAMPGGLDRQDYHTILRTIADSGYNTIRIPFSNQIVENPTVPSAIRFENESGPINADLEGQTSLQILDNVVFAAGELGLKVILDDHRSEAGSSAEANGLWYTDEYPEDVWVADWVNLATRYKGNPTVIGVDLRNEPHNATSGGACWDCGGSRDWHLAAERAGNAVLHANSNLLIFVEGTDTVDGDSDFWGGNLAGVRRSPVHLALPNRLVYSPHVYGPSEFQQPWFNAATAPEYLISRWHRNWGFISESGLAPIWIGEFGTSNDDASIVSTNPGSQGQWFSTLVAYLRQHPDIGWSYWGINGEDRYGLLDASYTTQASTLKSNVLASLRQPPTTPFLTTSPVPAQSPLIADASQPVLLELRPSPTSAPEPVNIVYAPPALARSASRTLQPEPTDLGLASTRGIHQKSHASTDVVAEQVRLATEQALRDLPPAQ